MKVLIVDPDSGRAATIADAFTGTGAQPAVAPSASFALTMLEWNRQDVIISRAQVGDMDGHELCSMIRADPSTVGVRLVLIATNVTPAQVSEIGIDLVIPDGLIGQAIVTRVMHLMRRGPEPAGIPASSAPPQAPATPAPSVAEPAPVLAAAVPDPAPRLASLPLIPSSAPLAPAPPVAGPPLAAAPPPVAPPSPVAPSPPVAPPFAVVAPLPDAVPPPVVAAPPPPAPSPIEPAPVAPPPAVAPSRPAMGPALKGAAPAPPPLTELEAVGMNGAMRTFQGALGSLALEDLAKAIVKGTKTGRLLLVLGSGGGMIAFDAGRIVHAEVGNTTGETAFQSLVAASHRESGGKFCFIPSAPCDLANVPKTITRSVAELLAGAAQAMNEER